MICFAWVYSAALDGGEPGICISPMPESRAGKTSPWQFYEEARALGLIQQDAVIMPIADQYPTPARRPSNSVLDTRATLERLGLQPVHWRTNLRRVLKELMP